MTKKIKMPVRTKDVELDGDYTGFKCTIVTSMPLFTLEYLQSNDFKLLQTALMTIITKWNFTDEDGEPLPQPYEMVTATDPMGQPVMKPKLDDNGKPILDDEGEPVMQPMRIPGVAFISSDLVQLISAKAAENVMTVPTP